MTCEERFCTAGKRLRRLVGLVGLGVSAAASAGLVPAHLASYEPYRVGQVRPDVVTFGCPLRSIDAAVRIARHFSGLGRDLGEVFSSQTKYDALLRETRCGPVSSEASKVVEILFKADQTQLDDEAVIDRTGTSRIPTRGLSLLLMEHVATGGRYLALVDALVDGAASRPELVTGTAARVGPPLVSPPAPPPEAGAGDPGLLGLTSDDLCAGVIRLTRESRAGFAGIRGKLGRSTKSSEHFAPGFVLLPNRKCDLVHHPRSDRWTYACRYRIEGGSEQGGLEAHRRLVGRIRQCLGSDWAESDGPGGPFSIGSAAFERDGTAVVASVFSVRSSLVTVHLSVEERRAMGGEQAR